MELSHDYSERTLSGPELDGSHWKKTTTKFRRRRREDLKSFRVEDEAE